MPKRIPTPPPSDDVRFFTIYQPYPLNANMESIPDRQKCARWIAEIIGEQYLIGLLYKPRSYLGSILIEVSKEFNQTDSLLGEHRWGQFLVCPTSEEQERFSQVFHSTYGSHRAAQKDGWRTIDVEDAWFKGWKQGQGNVFKNPYPETHWCDVPAEDRTNKPMCRPLPVAVKPPPEQPTPSVVGSPAWLEDKAAPNPKDPVVLKGAWAARAGGQGVAGSAKPAASAKIKPIPTAARTSSSTEPIPNIATSSAKVGAWGKGKPSFPNMGASSPAPTNTTAPATTAKPKTAWGAPNPRITSPAGRSAPPGLNVPVKVTTKAQISTPKTNSTQQDKGNTPAPPPPGLTRSSHSTSSSLTSASSTSTLNDSTNDTHLTKNKPFTWSDDVEEEMSSQMQTVSIATTPSFMDNLLGGGDIVDEEEEDPVFPSMTTSSVPAIENLWEMDYKVQETKKEEDLVCSIHKDTPRMCKKGICSERAKLERQRAREKAQASGGTNGGGANGNKNGGRGGQGGGKGGRKGKVNYQGTGGYESTHSGRVATRDDWCTAKSKRKNSNSRSPLPVNRELQEESIEDILEEDEKLSVWD